MSDIEATLTIDCDGHVVLTVANLTAQGFHGQYGTPGSWIGKADTPAGGSTVVTALFGPSVKTLNGAVYGKLDDGTPERTTFDAARPESCAAYVPPTRPVDTTPKPVDIGGHIVCIRPGSPTQEPVDCDSPLATTPYVDPTPPTTAVEPSAESTAVTVATDTDSAAQVRTGPAKTHAHVAVPAKLPDTGNGVTMGAVGAVALLAGALLVSVTRRRHPR